MTPASILCYSEEPDLAVELIRFARWRDLAPGGMVAAAALGPAPAGRPAQLAAAGAERVYVLAGTPPPHPDPHSVATALAAVVREARPTAILMSATKRGKEVAARLAGILDIAAETGVNDLRREGDRWVLEREALSGNAIARESILAPQALMVMTPGLSPPAGSGFPLEVKEIPGLFPSPLTERVEVRPKGGGGVHLESAERIVTVGRGLQKKEDVGLIESLARAMGASVGCTRPLAADAGWFTDDHWVGLTGHRVKPKLYVAVGVSGAVQHLVGMRGSKVVVAINKDPNAPIFSQADYRIPGDLYAVIPALLKALGAPPG